MFSLHCIWIHSLYFFKKYLLETFQNETIDHLRSKILKLLSEERYSVKKDILHIEKSYLTSADLHFKQNAAQVEVYRVSSTTTVTWLLIALGIFTSFILTLIVALTADFYSRNFAKNEIFMLLKKLFD